MAEKFGSKSDEPSPEDRWVLARGFEGDKPLLFRILDQRPAEVDPEQYRHLCSISWPYEPDNEEGMPSADEFDRMSFFEELLTPALESPGAAYMVIAATGNGLRQWHWYARDTEELMTLVNEVLEECEPFPVEFSVDEDPNWDAYNQLRGNLGT